MGNEEYPSISQIIKFGAPPEWLAYIIIVIAINIAILVGDVWTIIQHKKYSTKHPLQFLCTFGILQVFPMFTIMHTAGIIIPKSYDVCLFISEAYEAVTFLFFLRLVLTYMGGKKSTTKILKGQLIHINVFPFCFLFCLPKTYYNIMYLLFYNYSKI